MIRPARRHALFAARFREWRRARCCCRGGGRGGGRRSGSSASARQTCWPWPRSTAFPMLLETYRECLRDVFDMPALVTTLRAVQTRAFASCTMDTPTPSPFAAVAALRLCRELHLRGRRAPRRAPGPGARHRPGPAARAARDAELRELLDPDALAEVERSSSVSGGVPRAHARRNPRPAAPHRRPVGRGAARRVPADVPPDDGDQLVRARRPSGSASAASRARRGRGCGRYRDALGVPLPPGLPEALLARARGPARSGLAATPAHTAPSPPRSSRRGSASRATAEPALRRSGRGTLSRASSAPAGSIGSGATPRAPALRRRSLANLRHDVEPVESPVLGRLFDAMAGRDPPAPRPRRAPGRRREPAGRCARRPRSSSWRSFPRASTGTAADLDALVAAGEVVWAGVEPLGERDGRVALFLTDHGPLWRGVSNRPRSRSCPNASGHPRCARRAWRPVLRRAAGGGGGGFPQDTVDALWTLVWRGLSPTTRCNRCAHMSARRTREAQPAGGSPLPLAAPSSAGGGGPVDRLAPSDRGVRHGLECRDGSAVAHALRGGDSRSGGGRRLPGGFSAVYDVFRTLEEGGRIRRGFFVSGLGAIQFAAPAAVDLLRSLRDPTDAPTGGARPPPIPPTRMARW